MSPVSEHSVYKITMAPITLRIEVAEVQACLLPKTDVRNCTRNFASHEGAPTTGAFMVEEDTVACEHVVGFAIIFGDPERIQFCDAIGAARIEWGIFVLRDGLYKSIKLRSRRLVEPHVVLETTGAYGIEQAQGAEGINIACILRHFERDFDVRLRTEVVNFSRLDLRDDVYEVGAIRQVSVVELELVLPCSPRRSAREKRERGRIEKRTFVLIIKEMIDTRGIETRGATNDAVHLVAFLK